MDRLSDLPLGWTLLAFWCLAMTRSNGAYWIGRGIAAGTSMSRFAKLLDSPLYQRAQAMAARWGVLAVPLSFLTVGVQTFVQISAGVTRMPPAPLPSGGGIGQCHMGTDLRLHRDGGDPGLVGDGRALATCTATPRRGHGTGGDAPQAPEACEPRFEESHGFKPFRVA